MPAGVTCTLCTVAGAAVPASATLGVDAFIAASCRSVSLGKAARSVAGASALAPGSAEPAQLPSAFCSARKAAYCWSGSMTGPADASAAPGRVTTVSTMAVAVANSHLG